MSITCAVRLRNKSQEDEPQLPELRWAPQAAELEPKLPAQPLTKEPLFADKPGGGPRDFGAAQSSAVTAVPGFKSPKALVAGNLLCGLYRTKIISKGRQKHK